MTKQQRIMVCANCGNEWEEIEQPHAAVRMECLCTSRIDWSKSTRGGGHVVSVLPAPPFTDATGLFTDRATWPERA